ncbi:hypothetical protein CTM50_03860 [Prevotella intermedia]|uniref:Uncharacterized protein n=1 Tax=Prevotella intermedia TaxID=28131 RepID=A0A2D3NA12_PREIN|nr:hypothetical protein CTM50_03860 [Prevotella intermedia]
MRRNRRNIVGNNLPNERKIDGECVNIFHKRICRITTSLSTFCKTYCFTFQKRSYHFLTLFSLQNQCSLSISTP